jgi:tetratricopeptide (TPR) repeat protein
MSGYVGSSQCRECHEKFYEMWSTSHHGLAMQPFTAGFAKRELAPQTGEIQIGEYRYRFLLSSQDSSLSTPSAWVLERGPSGEKRYPIVHAMGGKNVYYFLTPRDKGRLQVLPIAFNVRTKKWYDATASMIRHFLDRTDSPVSWTDPLLTFNTSCHGCHVSQLKSNYDFATDSYSTVWAEPGINCETCHGPAEEHLRVCKEAPRGQAPSDIKIISTKKFTAEQADAMCAPCHAKMHPLTSSFMPGDRYFDHYGLATLEDPDFYPDGRDLGENYTYTAWRMSPCVKSGKLDCMHCHTSSGRYRFADPAKANAACLPCHKERVKNAAAHTHHKPDSEGNRCIACHMPMTEFALMRRSDHSMLPPTPAATIELKSPNGCNNGSCHGDKDAAWSDKYVREWHKDDYQAPVLHRAGLVQSARKRDWSRLAEILEYVKRPDRDEVFATSLIRLLHACPDARKWPALLGALKDPSPLVRSVAAGALEAYVTSETRSALVEAAKDEYRYVRVSAAASLAGFPRDGLTAEQTAQLKRPSDEYEAMLRSRLDLWTSHYNLGNYYADRGEPQKALDAYAASARLDPSRIPPLVNASMVCARQDDDAQARALLQRALKIEPANAEANFNMGLLLAEEDDRIGAMRCLRAAWKADPTLAPAAFNLAVLLAERSPSEAIELCRQAAKLRPDEPKYTYTLAFFLNQQGAKGEAKTILEKIVKAGADYPDAYMLLAGLYEQEGKLKEALDVYQRALMNLTLNERDRKALELKARLLGGR